MTRPKLNIFDAPLIEVIVLASNPPVQDSAKAKSGRPKITREMGYISTVRDAKDILEKLYKSS